MDERLTIRTEKYVVGVILDSTRQYVLMEKSQDEGSPLTKLNGLSMEIHDKESPLSRMIELFLQKTKYKMNDADTFKFICEQTFYLPNNIKKYVFYGIVMKENKPLIDGDSNLDWFSIQKENLLSLENPRVKGDGEIQYLIKLTKSMTE